MRVWIIEVRASNAKSWTVISVHLFFKEAREFMKDTEERYQRHRIRLNTGLIKFDQE